MPRHAAAPPLMRRRLRSTPERGPSSQPPPLACTWLTGLAMPSGGMDDQHAMPCRMTRRGGRLSARSSSCIWPGWQRRHVSVSEHMSTTLLAAGIKVPFFILYSAQHGLRRLCGLPLLTSSGLTCGATNTTMYVTSLLCLCLPPWRHRKSGPYLRFCRQITAAYCSLLPITSSHALHFC
ncbi:hypothetical protein HDK90DRAFT_477088 [Phyllosticta capitalensis]|uniref:Uncharacterized protein n=2 Tax=Phyllosticta capitalensis TaxID=121624 RepID=A0ABR1YZZ4_9PEZI